MMRIFYLGLHGLFMGALVSGCGDNGGATTGTDTGGTTGAGTTTGEATTSPTTDVATTGPGCIPGASAACTCTRGDPGAQVCAPDGKSYGECTCEGGSSISESNSNSNTDPTTGVGATTGGSGTTLDTTDGTTTTGAETDGTTTLGETLGETGGMPCEDPGPEPNDDELDAVEQDDQMCNATPGTIDGVLNGDADVDWFTYHTVDAMGCGFADPTSNLVLLADEGVRMCVFVECDQGDADFDCPMMAMAEDSPEGLPGCCTTGGALNFGLNCTGSMNESADIYVRLDEAPADACVAYDLTYTWGPV
jgi:hypothetical protein